MLLGIGLWAGFSVRFNAEDSLTYDSNPASVKGSPYGKVLALAMQGPIDFYWHQGETHSHSEILNADDHSGHSHSHSGHGHDHSGHHHNHSTKPEEAMQEDGVAAEQGTEQKTLRELAKKQIRTMGARARRRTNDRPLSLAHVEYLESVTEDKLRLAYELDPTNYTNYGNLHLFLSVNLGKSKSDFTKAQELALKTLEVCKKDQVDPASWVTAASAAYNILYHIAFYYDQYTVKEAKASLKEFDDCIATYEILLNEAVQDGRIISEERLLELQERVKYLGKLRHAQGVHMKRMMSGRDRKSRKFNSTNN